MPTTSTASSSRSSAPIAAAPTPARDRARPHHHQDARRDDGRRNHGAQRTRQGQHRSRSSCCSPRCRGRAPLRRSSTASAAMRARARPSSSSTTIRSIATWCRNCWSRSASTSSPRRTGRRASQRRRDAVPTWCCSMYRCRTCPGGPWRGCCAGRNASARRSSCCRPLRWRRSACSSRTARSTTT